MVRSIRLISSFSWKPIYQMSWLMKFVRKIMSQIESEWKLSVALASYTSFTIMSKQDHFIRFKAIKGKCVFKFIFLYTLNVSFGLYR
ncbi:hypothetical protein V2J09_003737 [Rumex salicifolius]